MKTEKLLCLFLLFAAPTLADNKRPLNVDDLFAIQDVTDPQTSPDGKWIAYVVEKSEKEKDLTNEDIYMVPASGGDAVRLTSHEEDDDTPRWSPDNKWLGFLSKRNKKKQVFLLARNGGEPVQLTEVKQGVEDFSWSPDSKKLALVIRDADPDELEEKDEEKDKKKPKPIVLTRLQFKFDEYGYLKELYNHIYVFDIGSKQMKQITSGPFDDWGAVWSSWTSTPQWSPDGKWIAFAANRAQDADANRNIDIFLVPSEGGELKKLTTNPGTDELPSWSPDGKWISYQTQVQPKLIWYDTVEAAVISVNGGDPKILTRELDRNCWNVQFSGDGKNVYCLLEDHGLHTLASIELNSGKVTRDVAGLRVIYDYEISAQGIPALLSSSYDLPYEVFTLEQGKSKQLTFTNSKVLENIQLGTTERIQFKSKDGTQVEGFVTKPPQFDASKKYPLLLWIHGGPTSQYSEEFDFQTEYFAANGYVVVRVNPRGSTGYGEEFCKAIFADWGNVDFEDVMAGVEHVISQGYVDPEKMGVGGWSYGGMLTDHVITKTTRFRAAASGASELNYFMDYGIDHYQYEWEMEMGFPWEKTDLYFKTSPFFKLNQVKTPTLIMCGESDWNVPLANSEQFYQGLRRLGVDTMLVVYPEQPHGIYVPSYRKDRLRRYVAWFDHYLKGAKGKVPVEDQKK